MGSNPTATAIGQHKRRAGLLTEPARCRSRCQRAEAYVRLHVKEPATGRWVKVELVAEFLFHSPVPSEFGPVLHRDDVAAGKTEALFSCAEARDFIDVDALLRAGYRACF